MTDLFIIVNTALRDAVAGGVSLNTITAASTASPASTPSSSTTTADHHEPHASDGAGAALPPLPGAPVAVLPPQVVHDELLLWACAQPHMPPRYMAGVVDAYLWTLAAVGIPAPAGLHCLLVDLRARLGQEYQVGDGGDGEWDG